MTFTSLQKTLGLIACTRAEFHEVDANTVVEAGNIVVNEARHKELAYVAAVQGPETLSQNVVWGELQEFWTNLVSNGLTLGGVQTRRSILRFWFECVSCP